MTTPEGANAQNEESVRGCAETDCDKPAEFYLMPVGPVSFEDYCDACPEHLGNWLLRETIEGKEIEYYEIHFIQKDSDERTT